MSRAVGITSDVPNASSGHRRRWLRLIGCVVRKGSIVVIVGVAVVVVVVVHRWEHTASSGIGGGGRGSTGTFVSPFGHHHCVMRV